MRRSPLARWSLALAMVLAFSVEPARAEPRPSHWLRQHSSLEWVIGVAAFRSALGQDAHAPGFDTFAGGGELSAGLDVYSGLGIVANGRVLAGSQAGNHYLEGLADVGLQLRVTESVRLRGGPTAGRCTLGEDSAVMVGGFFAGSIDLFALGPGRLSTTLGVRLDVDSMLGGRSLLPDRSLSFALGLGVRY
ncbi:MAG TPA: hypothetical protein VFF06_18400 [Polyangia bacterium]|nr:hypothetical protein [Polyangia bacterium]